MQQRRGTEEQWLLADPILAAGEIGFETDTNKFKIGNGVDVWFNLPYFINDGNIAASIDDYVPLTSVGAANGVASLDATGQVPVSQLQNIIDGAPALLDTLSEISDALANYAPLNSPTFTGLTDFQGIVDFSDAVLVGIDALPDQTGNTGKYLTTDGTTASWADSASPTPHPFSMIG